MLLWIVRWLAASLNLVFCGFITYVFIGLAPYFRVQETVPVGQLAGWLGGIFIVASALTAACGFLNSRLLALGLRWHGIATLGSLIFGVTTCLHDAVNYYVLSGQKATYLPWEYLYCAAGFAFIWGSVWAVVYGLAARKN